MKRDIYQEVTDKIIKSLEESTCSGSWVKPWFDVVASGADYNIISKKPYRGINIMLLWLSKNENGFQSDQWATFKQWKSKGASVKKGEKGTHIVFFKPCKVLDKETGEEATIRLARGYVVFNADQVEGYEAPAIAEVDKTPADTAVNSLAEFNQAHVEHGGNKACFIPSHDMIRMPHVAQFDNVESYALTLAHELTHWTGHKARLDRDFSGRFGSNAYAFEELVAELGAAFIGARLEISAEPRDDHAQYINSWLEVMKGDKRAIFKAASQAQQAVDLLLEAQEISEHEEGEEAA